MKPATILAVFLYCALPAGAEDAPAVKAVPDRPDAKYATGEVATWTVSGSSSGPLTYEITKDGAEQVANGTIDLSAGAPKVSGSRQEPGALVLRIFENGNQALPKAVGGALFDCANIRISASPPPDFDEFWKAKLAELAAVPVNPVLEKVDTPPGSEPVDYWKVTLDNIRRTHVRGQLARPQAEGKYPALLILQFAGVYPLKKTDVTLPAQQGWLVLNISAHDLPIDEPDGFYEEQKNGALKNYAYQGVEDRETSYFLRMFLGCVRAAEYLASRPDWDGRTLVVTGASQGGFQSFATAALFPKTSAMLVCVPAGCDLLGPEASPRRAFAWPYWDSNWGPKRDLEKVRKVAPYFDAVNFASRVKCPSLIAVGLLDETSRPFGVISAFQAIKAPKELLVLARSNHYGTDGAQQLYFKTAQEWKSDLAAGKPAPIAEGGILVDPFPAQP